LLEKGLLAGAAVVDGIKNHLWKTFKTAVQEWFNSKLEQVLGLGSTVWNLIKSGGLKLAMVGKMAWEGIKTMIPMALVSILVEKLVAKIVPVAGALMVIIEGLQAAWGAVSRIIAAFKAFFAFLKAVKTGAAGPKFATALVTAAIAVIDFVSNWLLLKLAKGAVKVGGKIKGLAKKILGRRKGRAKGRKARMKKPKKAKTKAKKKVKKPKKKPKKSAKDKKRDKKKDKERKKQERLAKAKRELPPKINRLLAKGVSKLRLKIQLGAWRLRYRLSKLQLRKNDIYARVNPGAVLTSAQILRREAIGKSLEPILKMAEKKFFDERRQNRTEDEQKRIVDSERAAETGSKSFLHLPTADQVEFFSKIKGGKIKLPFTGVGLIP